MPKATICPKELISPNPVSTHNLGHLEESIIVPIIRFLESCEKFGVKIIFSSDILDLIQSEAPWQESEDPKVRSYLDTWILGVISPLLKCENVSTVGGGSGAWCGLVGGGIGGHFKELINSILENSPKTILGKFHFGIYVKNGCGGCVECASCIISDSINDVVKIKYPWYLIYPADLPWQGDVPFFPPANWENLVSPKRHVDFGYLDGRNRSWCKDRLHGNHWDVQFGQGNGDYFNVGYDGKLLD
jgi:hypothetical protein